MATSHARAARAGVLALLVVLLVWAGSATAGTPTSATFTGWATSGSSAWQGHTFSVPAGDEVTVTLGWKNDAANLHLLVSAPDGSVIQLRDGHHHPKVTRFVAQTSGKYWVGVRAGSGHSSYVLDATWASGKALSASSFTVNTAQGSPVTVDPVTHVTSPDGDKLVLNWVGTPSAGTATRTTSGDVTYSPNSSFTGTDGFGFKVCDPRVIFDCSGARAHVSVSGDSGGGGTGGGGTGGGGTGGGGGSTTPGPLRWAPPVLSNPTTITLPPTGNVTLNLDNSKDYIIQYPDVRRVGELLVRGGRNIVIIGGASTVAPHYGTGVRNIQLEDSPGVVSGRVIHIEGLDIDGSGGGEADGIGIATPSAIVQIENVRITGLIGHLGSTHADVIQTWGGVQELRVYDLTGASHYNDLYLRRENSPLLPGDGSVILDHVNMFGYVNPSGWDIPSTIRSISIGTQPADTDCNAKGQCGPPNSDSSTNCQMPGTVTLNDFYAQPPSGNLARFAWPTDYMTTADCPAVLAADGQSFNWPALDGSVTGSVELGPPPGGDYVPAGSVGIGYVSPGYQSQ
jgi:hypothetical protein